MPIYMACRPFWSMLYIKLMAGFSSCAVYPLADGILLNMLTTGFLASWETQYPGHLTSLTGKAEATRNMFSKVSDALDTAAAQWEVDHGGLQPAAIGANGASQFYMFQYYAFSGFHYKITSPCNFSLWGFKSGSFTLLQISYYLENTNYGTRGQSIIHSLVLVVLPGQQSRVVVKQ